MVGLFIPLALGLTSKRRDEIAALSAMAGGIVILLLHEIFGWQFFLEPLDPIKALKLSPALSATASALLLYLICGKRAEEKNPA